MESEELLRLYLERLRTVSLEILEEQSGITVIEALKKAILFLEGEMSGY